mgnify:FL=1
MFFSFKDLIFELETTYHETTYHITFDHYFGLHRL